MREYEESQEYFKKHMQLADERYAAWLRRGGVDPKDYDLRDRESYESDMQGIRNSYSEHMLEIFSQNVLTIEREYEKRIHTLRRKFLCQRALRHLKAWAPVELLFGLLAWYSFSRPGDSVVGICYAFCALTCLAMEVLEAIIDRPRW
ncbi:MAG: hypothetical protein H0U76_03980 [Ktedonobacteraceae bacterium]|nr:hypothetical protein [Ktedonobacteraceae bacterium]